MFLAGALCLMGLLLVAPRVHAASEAASQHGTAQATEGHDVPASKASAAAQKVSAPASAPEEKTIAVDIKAALREQMLGKKSLMLVVRDKSPTKHTPATEKAPQEPAHAQAAPAHAPAVAAHASPAHAVVRAPAVVNPRASQDYIRARAAAMTGHGLPAAEGPHGGTAVAGDAHGAEVHWGYEGDNGPQNWGQLKPEFNACAIGKRQSPINIEDASTLQGPAEPLQFNYAPSSGTVVNNGHTIQVDVVGDNTLTVRGSVYKLLQFHFHTPSEEQVNYRNFAMVAHLVHKNNEGQLAVVAVLLDPGVTNALIDKVWTYMPLDVSDRVRMPAGLLDLNELLPKDQRYYQFVGSLTTPPCTEGVLWMVMKQPTQLGKQQIHLFQQLFPNNARPVQPVNGRPVRNAQ
jgi:carbonic anhydrase